MALPLLPIFSALGSGLTAGAGSTETTDSSMESTTTGSSDINRTEFSNKLLKSLEGLFNKKNLKGNFKSSRSAIQGQLAEVQGQPDFNVEEFVKGIMTQANNTVGNQLEESINLTESDIGGTQGTNSMAALLANRLGTDAASQLAGIEAQAVGEGEKIRQAQLDSQTNSIVGLTGAQNKLFTDFLGLIRGARTKQNQKTKEHTTGTSTSTKESPFNPISAVGGFLGGFKAPT